MAREDFGRVAAELAAIGRRFYARGWALGTSGNFSAVTSRQPLRLAITASSVPKGRLAAADIVECDEQGAVLGFDGRRASTARRSPPRRSLRASKRPSAETLLHLEIARLRGAGAILHTHSVWTTVLSHLHAAQGGVPIEGYEMLKGLKGVGSHEHREWIPIIENDQDMPRLARQVGATLERHRDSHAFLLSRHGLYTWGDNLDEAERHVEILEFLFEAVGRTAELKGSTIDCKL